MINTQFNIQKNKDINLSNKTIFITGASDGIGKSLSIKAANLGAKIILSGRSKKKLESIHDEIRSNKDCISPSIALLDFETADVESYFSLSETILKNFDKIDGLVHCAGILGDRTPIEQYKPEVWQRVMHVNLTAPFVLTQALFPALKLSNNPSIIFTSSDYAKNGKAFWGAYSVSKFGTESLSQILANENHHNTMRVNCINPGSVNTKMRLAAFPAENKEELKPPDDNDILAPYLYLLSDASIKVSGKSINAQ